MSLMRNFLVMHIFMQVAVFLGLMTPILVFKYVISSENITIKEYLVHFFLCSHTFYSFYFGFDEK